MTDKPKKLSDTARALLTIAATRDDHLIRPPQLPVAAAWQVMRSLLNAELAKEIPAPIDDTGYVWRQGDDGSGLMLRTTDLGLACIREAEGGVSAPHPAQRAIVAEADTDGTLAPEQLRVGEMPVSEPQAGQDVTQAAPKPEVTPPAAKPSDAVQETPTVPVRSARRNPLRQAAQALLATWDASASADALDEHLAVLRAALVGRSATSLSTNDPRKPRDTRRAQVLAMLNRPEGASRPQIAEARGWALHTVRGFLAGLGKNSISIDVLERVRQLGPNKADEGRLHCVAWPMCGSNERGRFVFVNLSCDTWPGISYC